MKISRNTTFASMKYCIALLALLSFIPADLVAAETTPTTNRSCCVQVPPGTPLSDNSLFHLDSTWTNDAARPLKLASFQGRPHVVTMFFSSCAYACPILVHDMKRIEAALPENIRTNVGFILISFDTDRDTPPVLAEFRARHELPANWTLLRGDTDDVLELAALLGIKFKKDARGDFAHSNVISLLDSNGEILLQQIGLNRDPQSISSALENIVKPETPHERPRLGFNNTFMKYTRLWAALTIVIIGSLAVLGYYGWQIYQLRQYQLSRRHRVGLFELVPPAV